MEKLNDLKDLLRHEVLDLYSAEEQIIAALPAMIEKAGNQTLKEALQQHLQITEQQRARLDQVQQLLMEGEEENESAEEGDGNTRRGFIAGLFRRNKEEKQECLGTKGLIEEGQKVMAEPMQPEVMDAAIIGCAQKIEHYEICGYGTAKAYAAELGLTEVERLLDVTLNEEYDADDQLTELAVGRLNRKAEGANSLRRGSNGGSNNAGTGRSAQPTKGPSRSTSSGNGRQVTNTKSASKEGSKNAGSKSAQKSSAGHGNTGSANKSLASGKGAASSKAGSKAAGKGSKSAGKTAAKKGNSSRGR